MKKKYLYEFVGNTIRVLNKIQLRNSKKKQMVVFNTSMNTDNLGDYIIMYYCQQILDSLFGDLKHIDISTHEIPSLDEERVVKESMYKFICGTNLLTSHIEQWWNWRLPDGIRKKISYRNVILLGAGWGTYQDGCSDYSKMVYRCLLHPTVMHSVRDQYTYEKLYAAGISNVINTGCPTMWRLTPEFCATIKKEKSLDVVTTITDYRRDIKYDNQMLEILGKNYRYVYLWLQGKQDEEYLKELILPQNLVIIPRSLAEYEEILLKGNIDYVGTRLHAGIFALNHKIRTIIISVDNRAIEISKDTGLKVVLRENVMFELEKLINSVLQMSISINQDNIKLFLNQFQKKEM